jgi:hypothetical protein
MNRNGRDGLPNNMDTIVTINPWHHNERGECDETFSYDGKKLFEYRGVTVYKNVAGSWDYVFQGMTITQRAGFHGQMGAMFIDAILDGTVPVYNLTVYNHLVAGGEHPRRMRG